MYWLFFYTKQNHHYLARTMDFAFEFNGIPTVVPRDFKYDFDLEDALQLTYGFVGTNLKVGRYRFGDGINEQGLAISIIISPAKPLIVNINAMDILI